MKNNKKLLKNSLILTIFTIISGLPIAMADDLTPAAQSKPKTSVFANTGPYIGVSGGYASVWLPADFSFANSVSTGGTTYSHDVDNVSGGFSYRIYAGYNILRFLSVETGYSNIPDASSKTMFSGTVYTDKATTSSWDVMLKLILPMDIFWPKVHLDLYGKIGAAAVSSDIDMGYSDRHYDNFGIEPIAALGAEYNFTSYFAVNAEVSSTFNGFLLGDTSTIDSSTLPGVGAITLGVIFKLPVDKVFK
jgi:hypothetical protein